MTNVAIVEDDLMFQRIILNVINQSICANYIEQIDIYSTAEDFLQVAFKEHYQILILEIKLPGMDGVELSRRLLNESRETAIIFLTTYESYAMDAFGLNVHKYILKESISEKLADSIFEIISTNNKKKTNCLIVRTHGMEVLLNEEDIICVIYEDRHPIVYTIDQKIVVVGSTLRQVGKKLNHSIFVQPNNGTIINLKHVKSLSRKSVLLDVYCNQIPISRGRYENVREKYMNYLIRGEIIRNG